jgi:hypothetical protein
MKDISGEYYLRGVPEMASGFKMNEDQSFQFFLIYGALDRYGSGKWSKENNGVVLQSRPWSGKDFALVSSRESEDPGVTLKVIDSNDGILRYVYASLQKGGEKSWSRADEKGIIRFAKQEATSISLAFEFCPERFSTITNDKPLHNHFEFRFEPWFVEFFFNNFRLAISGNDLKGKHPLLDGEEFRYERR